MIVLMLPQLSQHIKDTDNEFHAIILTHFGVIIPSECHHRPPTAGGMNFCVDLRQSVSPSEVFTNSYCGISEWLHAILLILFTYVHAYMMDSATLCQQLIGYAGSTHELFILSNGIHIMISHNAKNGWKYYVSYLANINQFGSVWTFYMNAFPSHRGRVRHICNSY